MCAADSERPCAIGLCPLRMEAASEWGRTVSFCSLPSSVIDYIENSSDVDTLRRLTLDAASTESLNAFISHPALTMASC